MNYPNFGVATPPTCLCYFLLTIFKLPLTSLVIFETINVLAKKIMMSKGNALTIVIIIIAALIVGGFAFSTFVLPKLINKTVETALNSSLEGLNFDNAQSVPINQDLSNNEGMFLQLTVNKGKITIDENSQGDVIAGEIKYLGTKPIVDYQTAQDKLAIFTIKSSDQAGENVALHLSQQTNGRIDISLGAGSADVDLTNLDIPVLSIAAGAGVVNVTFSNKASTEASLVAGTGKLNIKVYKGTGIKVKLAQGINSNIDFGDSYEKVEEGYQTKNYNEAKVKIDLSIGQALGGFNIEEIK